MKKIKLSRAKTAYGLINDVIKAIREEPKRLDMNTWLSYFQGKPNYSTYKEDLPSCGTIGCFAGWVCVLRGVPPGVIAENAGAFARNILGRNNVNYNTVENHRSCSWNLSVFAAEGHDLENHPPIETPEYAEIVIRRIQNFQKINAKVLRAQKLELIKK